MSVTALLSRFWHRVRRWFVRPFVRSVPAPDAVSAVPVPSGPVPPTGPVPLSGALRRIQLLTSGLRPFRRRIPSVRCLPVSGFPDAYRFLIRLGGCSGLTVFRAGGSLRCRTVLPDGAGTLELIERSRISDRRIVAVLYLRLSGSVCPVTEIRFVVRSPGRTLNPKPSTLNSQPSPLNPHP